MKVKCLKMEAFRGIGDLTLKFGDTNAIVFIGINGVGKSSILDCLAILLSQLIGRITQNENFEPNFNTGINIAAESITIQGSSIHGDIYFYPRGSNQLSYLQESQLKILNLDSQDITKGGNKTKVEITIVSEELLTKSWYLTQSLEEDIPNFIDKHTQLNSLVEQINKRWKENRETAIPLAVFYKVNRAVINIPLDSPTNYSFKQTDAYEQALSGIQINFDTFFQWFKNLEDLENEKRRDDQNYRNHQLEAVREAVYSLIPDFSNLRMRRFPLRMTVEKRGEEFTVNQLSDGEKCLLAMVGDLARRLAIANPSLENPLNGEGVVLIDEIELHLHPKWQREIIPALSRTFSNCQFIVTTHSPQVISHVEPEGIFILEKTNAGVIAKRPESSFGRDSNRILEDLMGVPARPQEIKDTLHQLFQLIEEGNLEDAKKLRQEIVNMIGDDEPELVKASVSIRRKEILKR
ncbi:MAG: AAA family ATPase [Scytonematopsis contorta HA4267-MV1]|nr:AAA family ATPase [Scytonematopsis contorta HA4267-MV1]